MMNLEEMKLAVCEKLPDLIEKCNCNKTITLHYKWKFLTQAIYWPTEGLQVCHEAEKVCKAQFTCIHSFDTWLRVVTHRNHNGLKYKKGNDFGWPEGYPVGVSIDLISGATYEQRLEALCRVWFPEKFTT